MDEGVRPTRRVVFHNSPAPLSGERDHGHLPDNFEPPHNGAHLRIVQSPALPAGYAAC